MASQPEHESRAGKSSRRTFLGTTAGVALTTIGSGGKTVLSGAQVRDRHSMLALRVNGADISLDHGYPARVIVPAAPGTHNRKWIRQMTFVAEA